MSRLAEVRVERVDGVPLACVSGQIDISNRTEVGDRLAREVANVDHGLVVDLSEVRYLDSAGVTLLFALAERLRDRQLQLRLVVPEGARIRRLLDVVNMGSVASIDGDTKDSVRALRALGG
jgi:anti-anti-sigma factor